MSLNERAKGLAEDLKATKEFIELKQAKIEIGKDKTLKSEVEGFNKQQAVLFSGKLSAKEAEAKTEELNKKFGSLSKIPEVDRYIKASRKFNEMMENVYKSISDSIDRELKLQ